ncbi:MAG TPA: hypothetical protein VF773_10880 [Verrucomicrobiae bacterium]
MNEHFQFRLWRGFSPERLAVLILVSVLALLGIAATQLGSNTVKTANTIAEMVSKFRPNGVYREIEVQGYYAPGDGGGGFFVATNNVTATNLGTRIYSGVSGWSWERVRGTTAYDLRWFGAKPDGTTINDVYLESALGALSAQEDIAIVGGPYVLDSVVINKDVGFLGVNNAKLLWAPNATSDMFTWSAESTREVQNIIFDANIANQTTNNWYAMIRPKGGAGKGQRIHNNTFQGWVRGAIIDWLTRGRLEVYENAFLEGMKIPFESPHRLAQYAMEFSPGHTNTNPYFLFTRNIISNSPAGSAWRNSGGVGLYGNETNSAFNEAVVTHNVFINSNGTTTNNSTRTILPDIDWYRYTLGISAYNVATNYADHKNQFGHAKYQQSPDLQVIGNRAHSEGDFVYSYSPGERNQTNEFQKAVFRDNWAWRGTNDTIGFNVRAGDSGGWHEVEIDGFYAQDFARGMQIEGQTDLLLTREGYGPVTLRNVHITNATTFALQLINTDARVSIYDCELFSSGSGTALRAYETNWLAQVNAKNSRFEAKGTGWGARVWGIGSFASDHCTYVSASGEAVEFRSDSGTGTNILKLFFEGNNTISGVRDIQASQIEYGYFKEGAATRVFPGGFMQGPTSATIAATTIDLGLAGMFTKSISAAEAYTLTSLPSSGYHHRVLVRLLNNTGGAITPTSFTASGYTTTLTISSIPAGKYAVFTLDLWGDGRLTGSQVNMP